MSKELIQRVDELCKDSAESTFCNLRDDIKRVVQQYFSEINSDDTSTSYRLREQLEKTVNEFKPAITTIMFESEQKKFIKRFSELFNFIEQNATENSNED